LKSSCINANILKFNNPNNHSTKSAYCINCGNCKFSEAPRLYTKPVSHYHFRPIKLHLEKLRIVFNGTLDEREKEILEFRYGLNGKEELTQREIAKKLGISRSYVSRIETAALKKLKRQF